MVFASGNGVTPVEMVQRETFGLAVQRASDDPAGSAIFEENVVPCRLHGHRVRFTRRGQTCTDQRAPAVDLRLHLDVRVVVEGDLFFGHFFSLSSGRRFWPCRRVLGRLYSAATGPG